MPLLLMVTCYRVVMNSEHVPFPVRLVFTSPAEPEPIIDQVYEDRQILLQTSVPLAGRTDTQEHAHKLLQGKTIMFESNVLAVFAWAA